MLKLAGNDAFLTEGKAGSTINCIPGGDCGSLQASCVAAHIAEHDTTHTTAL